MGARRRFIRVSLIVAVVGIVLLNLGLMGRSYAAANSAVLGIPATQNHHIFGSWRGQLPLAREIRQAPDTTQLIDGQLAYQVANYYPGDQTITEKAVFHTLPQTQQDATMRHEYGHALMADIVNLNHGAVGSYYTSRNETNRIMMLTADADSGNLPDELRPIWEDFVSAHRSNPNIYGAVGCDSAPAGYYTCTFGEFFAASFGKFCGGSGEVPARTAAALEHIEELRN